MANFNGKGPEEKGSRTGRGLGKCGRRGVISEEWGNKKRDGEGFKKGRSRGKGRGFGLNKQGAGKGKGDGNYNYDL